MNASSTVAVSVIIPTKNEERNIEACLDGVAWAAEVIVFDSMSTDATLDLAKAKGAKIVQREFDNFSDHKNWAIDNIEFENHWLLIVDADERVTPPLAEEIRVVVEELSSHIGYYIARKNLFSGRWIKHAGMYPDWQLRLFQAGKARYEKRLVHEHMLLDGSAGHLKTPFTHYDDKGIARYIDRHNVYSTLEAVEVYKFLNGPQGAEQTSAEISSDASDAGPGRRRRLKQFAYRWLPFRPAFVFLWMYFIKLGILEGRIGFQYCLLRAVYEFQIDLKLDELKRDGSPLRDQFAEELKQVE
jgi:glycosyltransferase involved in cell wall biosynthesis